MMEIHFGPAALVVQVDNIAHYFTRPIESSIEEAAAPRKRYVVRGETERGQRTIMILILLTLDMRGRAGGGLSGTLP